MCGGCGGARRADWTTAALGSTAARAAAARAVDRSCRDAGLAVRVSVGPSGYVVRRPTGSAAVAATVTDVWRAVAGRGGTLPALDPPRGAAGAGPTTVTAAPAAVTVVVRADADGWDGQEPPDGAELSCPDLPALDRALRRLVADPLRHRVRVVEVIGPDWPTLPAPRVEDREQVPALLAWAAGLQVGGHTRGRRLELHGPGVSIRVADGHALGVTC